MRKPGRWPLWAHSGPLQGGSYQRKEQLWQIILKTCTYKAKICVLNKLHFKMFITWSRLHIFISMMILFVVQVQTPMSKVFILLFRVCPCVDVIVYVVMNNSVLNYPSQH